jgi:hypothetical protein
MEQSDLLFDGKRLLPLKLVTLSQLFGLRVSYFRPQDIPEPVVERFDLGPHLVEDPQTLAAEFGFGDANMGTGQTMSTVAVSTVTTPRPYSAHCDTVGQAEV